MIDILAVFHILPEHVILVLLILVIFFFSSECLTLTKNRELKESTEHLNHEIDKYKKEITQYRIRIKNTDAEISRFKAEAEVRLSEMELQLQDELNQKIAGLRIPNPCRPGYFFASFSELQDYALKLRLVDAEMRGREKTYGRTTTIEEDEEVEKLRIAIEQDKRHINELNLKMASLRAAISQYKSDLADYEDRVRLVKDLRQSLDQRQSEIESEIMMQCDRQLQRIMKEVSDNSLFSKNPVFADIIQLPLTENKRLITAYQQNADILNINVKAEILGQKGDRYETTLYRCTCPDFQYRKRPCKHMYRLALEVGIFRSLPQQTFSFELNRLIDEEKNLKQQTLGIHNQLLALRDAEKKVEVKKRELAKIINDNSQQYPWLAKMIADYQFFKDEQRAKSLETKKRPSLKSAEQVREISEEKKLLQAKCKMLEYQLNYFESLFPWLEDFKKLDPKEGAKYVGSVDSEYDNIRKWLSPEEYQSLPSAQKNQLALNRWLKRKRSDWEAGIEYERYIGYLYELEGYRVHYSGATMGLEDMGRDLIAEKNNTMFVIQCKRWSQKTLIHEKHIFQLYGSTVLMSLGSKKHVFPCFITTANLSDKARECAEYLKVELRENYPYEDHPWIKCNISKAGNKIYHLPFDQQYDRVVIDPKSGEFYAWSVQEAEEAGFRRAFRWHAD